jgi:hypothetical protein
MNRKTRLSVIVAGLVLLGITGTAFSGVEPSPFQPEINKLHAIELQVAAINKRLSKLDEYPALPNGTTNYLSAMANQMQGVQTKLDEVLLMLPPPSVGSSYIGQDEAIFALDSIRVDSKDAYIIVGRIVSRMGVEPSPFLPVFNDVSLKIIVDINDHLLPVMPILEPPHIILPPAFP